MRRALPILLLPLILTGCLRSVITIIDNGDGSLTLADSTLMRNDFIEQLYGEPPTSHKGGGDGMADMGFASSDGGNFGDVKRGSIFRYERFAKDTSLFVVDRPRHLESYNYGGLASTVTTKLVQELELSAVDLFGQGAAVSGEASPMITISNSNSGVVTATLNEEAVTNLVQSRSPSQYATSENRSHVWWKEMYVHIEFKSGDNTSTLLHFNGALLGDSGSSHTPLDGIQDRILPTSLSTEATTVLAMNLVSTAINNDAGPAHDANSFTPQREAKDLFEEINETLTFADYWRVYQQAQPKSEFFNFKPESEPDASMGYMMLVDIIPEPVWLGSPVSELVDEMRQLDIPFTAVTHDSGRTITFEQHTPWRATFDLYENREGGLAGITKYTHHDEPSDQLMGIIKTQSKKRLNWINATDQVFLEESDLVYVRRYHDPLRNHSIEASTVYTKVGGVEKPWRLTSTRRVLK